MSINDKIKFILKDKNLTPSHFADEIGVQRSSISHILSGRNRPSFDIIQKIIRRFPDLGYDWILEEEESVPIVNRNSQFTPQTTAKKPVLQPEIPQEKAPAVVPDQNPITNSSAKTIERILIFYSDGTFKEYSPS
ncbi:helix-turn-helix transcriptional regulator [Tellurirhabdus bombi]|uniref:helix-turn-helix transcriptional regulator n=1 Tax=Tellurirhabdus bombi TaxID=2907205 RepID=UPI001F1BBBC5|nr:helix-turn-helix transcriptional regulator [Tellurirhabdus bombi]